VYYWGSQVLKKITQGDVNLGMPHVLIQSQAQQQGQELKQRDVHISAEAQMQAITTAENQEIDQVLATADDGFFGTEKGNVDRAAELAAAGAMKYFNMNACEVASLFIFAFILSVANSLLVWFSPCIGTLKCQS